jgi:hypothetical protein
MYGNPGA